MPAQAATPRKVTPPSVGEQRQAARQQLPQELAHHLRPSAENPSPVRHSLFQGGAIEGRCAPATVFRELELDGVGLGLRRGERLADLGHRHALADGRHVASDTSSGFTELCNQLARLRSTMLRRQPRT